MNWAALTAIAAVCAIFSPIFVGAFIYGKLTQRVSDIDTRVDGQDARHEKHEERFEKVAERFDVHSERIGEHDVKIGKIEEWKQGFSTGVQATKGGQ